MTISALSIAQVGVNTPDPKSTLDITAKSPTGNSKTPEGLLVPRVDRQRAQSMTGIETSTMIYVDDISTGTQTGTAINIDAIGYYYFNGKTWIMTDANIYKNNGTLAGNRVVTQNANTLSFTGNAVDAFSVDGSTLSVDAANNRVGIGTKTPASVLAVVNPTAGNTIDAFSAGINNCGIPCGQQTARNITLFNANGTNSMFAGIDFIPATNVNGISGASIKGIDRDVANGYAGFQFYTRNASGYAPRMTIKSSGNIGVGTQAPTTLFHVESTTNGAVKIVDGTQGANKVLTSDANGVATWQRASSQVVVGSQGGGIDIPFENSSDLKFTGASITLPPGKWMVTVNQIIRPTDLTATEWMWVRSTFSDQVLTIGEVGTQSADITVRPSLMSFKVQGPTSLGTQGAPWFDMGTGFILINNSSGANKTYRYIAGGTATNVAAPGTKRIIGYGSTNSENVIFASAIN